MGLDATALRLIAPHLAGAVVLCLSYPDLAMPVQEVRKELGIEPTAFTDFGKHHKLDYKLAETREAFELAGARQVAFMDIQPSRGCETVIDLNQKLAFDGAWDLVIDPGTLEHCFNIGQAFDNAWRAVRVGGHIVHVHPLQMINHGFWNICPTALVDFYAANGGELIELLAADRAHKEITINPTRRFHIQEEAVLYSKFRKAEARPLVWPSQTRYRPKEAQ